MKTNIPHNVITISEMNKHKNSIRHEIIMYEDLRFDEATVKSMRASSSMFNKSIFVQVEIEGKKFNIESIKKTGDMYKLMLISNEARIELEGKENEAPDMLSAKFLEPL